MEAKISDTHDRYDQILNFLMLLDRFKSVERRSYLVDHSRRESDAEHTWHMIMFALLTAPKINVDGLDMLRVIELIMIHDLGEIFAGDTFAYADVSGKHEKEEAAFRQLIADTPNDVALRLQSAWSEYHQQESPESRFVYAIDRLQGFAQQIFARGKTWREFGITRDRTLGRTDPIRSKCAELVPLLERLYDRGDGGKMWPTSADVRLASE
jgi:putative hydrolases of HD superfamily